MMTIPRRLSSPTRLLLLAATLAGSQLLQAGDELTKTLDTFRSWKQGSSVSQLAQTRQAVFRGTADPAVRARHEAGLLTFLQGDADIQAKQRVIGWLGEIAGDPSVPALASLLDDPDLASAARGALERIPGEPARTALVKALGNQTGPARIGIVHALGRRNEASSVKELVPLLDAGNDPDLQRATLAALGSIDAPEAREALRRFSPPAALATSHGLALLATADYLRKDKRPGESTEFYCRLVMEECDSLAEEAFFSLMANAANPGKNSWLRSALGDERLRATALRRIQAGDGSVILLGEMVEAMAKDPDHFHPLTVHALAARPEIRDELRPVLAKALDTTSGDQRLLAIKALATAGGPDEASLLLALAAGKPQEDQAERAAFTALTLMPAAAAGQVLLDEAAKDSDPARQKTAITLLGARGGQGGSDCLWTIARNPKAANQDAAASALAAMLPPEEFPRLLEHYLASEGAPKDAAKAAVWQMLRRLPDRGQAVRQVEAAAAKANPESAAALQAMLQRIKPDPKKKPKPTVNAPIPLPEKDDRAVLRPNGYREVIRHDSGAGNKTQQGDFRVRRLAGKEFSFFAGDHPLATVDFGEEVRYEFTGLDPKGEYVVGLTWWDADRKGRRQEVRIDGQIALPSTPPLAWHADKPTWSRLHLPVPTAATKNGSLDFQITKTAGVNAVVSQAWLLQRVPKTQITKRVLIVTGDDYPGHRWRETGPELARILREDPRLEVTISETPFILGSPLLEHYDAVMIHFKNYAKRLPTTRALWTNLDRFVRDGGGLVVAHFGCGALQEWDGFVKLGGRTWNPKLRGHDPYGEFLVRILNDSHPATRGMKQFTTRDELYTCLDGDTAIEVLAEATSKVDQKNYPMAFTVRETGKGRVFHCPLGHDTGALVSKGTRQLYRQGTAWAAGL